MILRLTVSKCPLWTVKVALIHFIKLIPRWELAPPPRPFIFAALPPLLNRSTQAFKRGTTSCGGNFFTVFRINVSSECAKQISSNPESDECKAWINVRANDWTGTADDDLFPDFLLEFVGLSSSRSLSEEVFICFKSTPEEAARRCPRLSSARSTSKSPSDCNESSMVASLGSRSPLVTVSWACSIYLALGI